MIFFHCTAADTAGKLAGAAVWRRDWIRPQTHETSWLKIKADNKSQILSLNLSAWEDEDTVSTSNCLILIFLFNVSFHLLLFWLWKWNLVWFSLVNERLPQFKTLSYLHLSLSIISIQPYNTFSFLLSFVSVLNFSSVCARFTLRSPPWCSDASLLWPHPHVNNKPHSAPPHLWGNPLAGLSDEEQYRCFVLTDLFLPPWSFLNDFQTQASGLTPPKLTWAVCSPATTLETLGDCDPGEMK